MLVSKCPYRLHGVTGPLREQRARGYETSRPDVQALVPLTARRILELGCSSGSLGAAIKARQDAVVVGVEISDVYAEDAARRLDRVIIADAETFVSRATPDEAPFDCLIAADVLEHLVDPWSVLSHCAGLLSPGASVVISLPNVLYLPAMLRLIRERRWPRDPEGIFDATHLRWFTPEDAVDMLRGAGFTPMGIKRNYFSTGWKLRVKEALARTPLREYLAEQLVISAVLPL
jgi:2-polyprenyl-3-methyl-5-hydroxy-6-metoxy-1,4-benzoquinol methylase